MTLAQPTLATYKSEHSTNIDVSSRSLRIRVGEFSE